MLLIFSELSSILNTMTSKKQRGKIIGITGGIACGKTTVSQLLAEKGAIPINADEIGHQLLKSDSPIIDELTETFGQEILDETGDVSRKKLGAIVFKHKELLDQLNTIIHPLIINRSRSQARKLVEEDSSCVVLLDAPLLIEAGAHDSVDIIVVVTSSPDLQLKRIIDRSHLQNRPLTEKEAQARIDSQMPLSEKIEYADKVIENNGSLEMLKDQVDQLWTELMSPARVN